MTYINKRLFITLISFILLLSLNYSCKNSENNNSGSYVEDVDKIRYKTIKIGSQIWMSENLKVTRFSNGDPIPLVTENIDWEEANSGSYCYYQNDIKYDDIYGKLYNWRAVNDPRGLCPDGWHIPTDGEWQLLSDYLGGNEIAGNKMKEVGSKNWEYPNNGASNVSGFTALPAGGRDEFGEFIIDKYGGHWWSITEDGDIDIWVRSIYFGYGSILRDSYHKNCGFSVRCIKN